MEPKELDRVSEKYWPEGAIPVIIGRNEADNQLLLKKSKRWRRAKSVQAELTDPEDCEKAVNSNCQIWPY